MTRSCSTWLGCARQRLVAALLMCASSVALAQAPSPAACPPAAKAPSAEQVRAGMKTARDHGFLWRIRKDGRSSYLYGTVHVAKPDWAYPGATLMNAVRASDVVALELDLLDPAIVERLRAAIAWRPERSVDAQLTQRLRQQLQAACLPEQMLTAVTPEMVATTLTVMAARRDGLDPAYGIDIVLAGLAHGLKKPVESLETPELQLRAILGRTPEEARALVEQSLDELENGRAEVMLERIAQVWADGRFDELERYEQWCECVQTADERKLLKRLLDERNPGMAERIDALHTAGRQVFAAVGSLHMIGPLGLPALLAQRGYQVERVR